MSRFFVFHCVYSLTPELPVVDTNVGYYFYCIHSDSSWRSGVTVVQKQKQLEMRSVERGICPIAKSTMTELFQ